MLDVLYQLLLGKFPNESLNFFAAYMRTAGRRLFTESSLEFIISFRYGFIGSRIHLNRISAFAYRKGIGVNFLIFPFMVGSSSSYDERFAKLWQGQTTL